MKVKSKLHQEQLNRIKQSRDHIHQITDGGKMEIFQALKSTLSDRQIIDIIYDTLEKVMSTSLNELHIIYPDDELNKELIDLAELLYSGDNKTLEDRVKYWTSQHLTREVLFAYLCRIIDTEAFHILNGVIQRKIDKGYVEIVGFDGCECEQDGPCSEYAGEIFKISSMTKDMWPPYHPLCECSILFWEEEDIEEE